MNRPLRRQDRQLPEAESRELLLAGTEGFLATVGEGGEPYVIAVNYVLMAGTIYVHSARHGHKVDNLRSNPLACFSVVAHVKPGGNTTYYQSVVAFCRARLLEEGDEWEQSLVALGKKYLPHGCDPPFSNTLVIALDIRQLSGKANRPPSNPATGT
ncbi:MAG TPA: nitroimidazole resistance protein NimI [Clostridiales bacterium UBA8153]|nr:nitroimidazole resistance protein NimI [Clostridiales bacterium UBA8153]